MEDILQPLEGTGSPQPDSYQKTLEQMGRIGHSFCSYLQNLTVTVDGPQILAN